MDLPPRPLLSDLCIGHGEVVKKRFGGPFAGLVRHWSLGSPGGVRRLGAEVKWPRGCGIGQSG